jgi:hypothetical protein
MVGSSSMQGSEDKCVHKFGWKARSEEINRKFRLWDNIEIDHSVIG